MPVPFIKSQARFEQGEIVIAELFSRLTTMLPDCLFLQGASHAGGRILTVEVLQLQEVFHQHDFPLIQGAHIFILLMHKVIGVLPSGHLVHSPSVELSFPNKEALHTRQRMKEGKRAPTGWTTRGVDAGNKCHQLVLFPCIHRQGSRGGSYVKLGMTTCQMPPNPLPAV